MTGHDETSRTYPGSTVANDIRPIFVCQVASLDLRRLPAEHCPHIRRLLDTRPWVRTRGQPDVEMAPSMFTGTLPHEHGVWQVRRRDPPPERGPVERMVDLLPDVVTTTAQGIAHALTAEVDLATIPPRRRRKFEIHRFKYERRLKGWTEPSGRHASLFSLLGKDRSRYRLVDRFSQLDDAVAASPAPGILMEWLEVYAFDLTSHWNLDRPDVMADALGRVDAAVAELHAACEEAGVRFLLLCDHGQEPVERRLDLEAEIEALDVDACAIEHFMEPVYARFWFDSEAARERVEDRLRNLPELEVRTPRQMTEYGIHFPHGAFGELYAYARPGTVLFPHDFYQPVANLYIGLTHLDQRARILNPVHRGTHGHLPEHPSEEGFLLCADDGVEAVRERMQIVEVAITLLGLLGEEPPETMRGRPALRSRR